MYEKMMSLVDESYQHWLEHELFSFGWFLMVIVLAVVYVAWFLLLDKKRAVSLLLLGSLAAVAYHFNDMVLLGFFGKVRYEIRLTPLDPEVLIASVTLSPIILMLVQQYTSTWKGYLLWSLLGLGVMDFVLYPIYTRVGILSWHEWNYFFHFLVLYGIAIGTRAVYLWITGTQQRNRQRGHAAG